MKTQFVLCIDDGGYPESLEKRKFYKTIPDHSAEKENMIRVIDESGEDYLYPKSLFQGVRLPHHVEQKLVAA